MQIDNLQTFFNLSEVREKFGLSQKHMADMLFINIRTYQAYEKGEQKMPRPMFELLKYKVFELHFCLTELHYKSYADTFKP